MPRTETLAFKDDVHLQETALSDLFIVWSTNKTDFNAAAHASSNSTEPPWTFHAVEVVHNLCVNTYQVSFTPQNSTTAMVASSYVPKYPRDTSYNLTTNCAIDPSGVVLCDIDPELSPNSNTTLVDPDDENKVYVADSLALLRMHLAEMLDGFLFYSGADERYDYLSLADWFRGVALWGDVQHYSDGVVITDPEVQVRNIASYYGSIAIALSNL